MQYPALVTSSGLACITDFAHVGEIGDIGHKGGSYDENAPIELASRTPTAVLRTPCVVTLWQKSKFSELKVPLALQQAQRL
jgi:hypothetical protein